MQINTGIAGRSLEDVGRKHCSCEPTTTTAPLIALTGGPGAGKTAVLEMVRRLFCRHVMVLPEAAGIVYGGGFPRAQAGMRKRAAQCAIYHVQRQLERIAEEPGAALLGVCDRGTIDGLAYWPDSESSYWQEVAGNREAELSRYAAIIHLRTPNHANGYNHQNPLRTETAEEAARIDARIFELWSAHPRRTVIESSKDFMTKVSEALAVISAELHRASMPLARKGT